MDERVPPKAAKAATAAQKEKQWNKIECTFNSSGSDLKRNIRKHRSITWSRFSHSSGIFAFGRAPLPPCSTRAPLPTDDNGPREAQSKEKPQIFLLRVQNSKTSFV